MSKVFKSTNVNYGEPFKINMNDNEIFFNKKRTNKERSSDDLKNEDPSVAASAIIERANIEANEIIEKINAQAEQMLQDARVEAEQLKSDIVQQGYEEGYQKGIEEGKKETEELAHQALEIKEELDEERKSLVQKFENEIPDIIIQCVNKVIGEELTTNKDAIVNLVSNALNKAGLDNATVRVSEQDIKNLEENKEKVVSECKDVNDFEIKKDLSMQSGDCIVETENGEVDASVNTQLEKLEENITEVVDDDDSKEN